MEFTKLKADTDCDCLENSTSQLETNFAIKIMKDHLRVQDFISYWDKGRRSKNDDCQEICSLKGNSVSVFEDDTKEQVIEIFKGLFPLAPKYKPYLFIVKFKHDCGNIKHTPDELNPFHYDFYKCDTFDLSQVSLIKVNELH